MQDKKSEVKSTLSYGHMKVLQQMHLARKGKFSLLSIYGSPTFFFLGGIGHPCSTRGTSSFHTGGVWCLS